MLVKLIKKHAFFGIVFSIAKATVYFMPLILADVLSNKDFGILEYALAGLGMLVNTIINLGVPGAYPYFILRKKDLTVKNGFIIHPVWLTLLFIFNQIAYFALGLSLEFYLAFNISFIIANQVFYSAQLKSHEKSTFAVLLDSGIYIILLLFFLASKLNLVETNIKIVGLFIFAYSLLYVAFGIFNFIGERKIFDANKYKKILKFSIRLLISTFLIFLITTSGRILVEYFFDFEAVGVYAFYFRLSAIVVMIHQIVNIAFFKKMYTLNPLTLDKYYHLFFIFIFILSIIIFWLSPYIISYFSNFFNETFTNYKPVYFLLSAQMVMWIASALNSNIIDRENLAAKNSYRFFILIVISGFFLILIKDSLSLELLTYCHYSIIFLACLIQYFSLSKKKINFFKSAITLTLTFLFTSCYYFMFL